MNFNRKVAAVTYDVKNGAHIAGEPASRPSQTQAEEGDSGAEIQGIGVQARDAQTGGTLAFSAGGTRTEQTILGGSPRRPGGSEVMDPVPWTRPSPAWTFSPGPPLVSPQPTGPLRSGRDR